MIKCIQIRPYYLGRGVKVHGYPVKTYSRGKLVYENGGSEAKRDGENLLNVLLNNEIAERRLMICSD